MSVESRPNKLTKGLVLDTFHTDVDNTVATYALNAQLEDQEGNHFHYGSEVGTTFIKDIPDNHVVIGHINMERNETVLFTTDGTNSTIGVLSRNDDMSYHYEIKVDDSKQTKKLGFKKEGYVRGVYRLLNGCDKVIYFVDGINKDRRININQLDSYKLPDTQSVASGIIFDDSLRATIYALSSATGNIQLIRLLSASPEATANVLATLTSGESLTKLLTASANGIGTAFANLMRTANMISSTNATGTSTANVDIIRLLQSNVSAIGSVNAILESITQGLVQIDVTLSGVASSTAILLRAALLESNITTEASTLTTAILTRIINAQVQASATTTSTAKITVPVNASANATSNTAANAILSYAVNATANAIAQTSATAQLSQVINASLNATATSSVEALIGLVLVSTTTANGSVSTADLYINRLLSSSVTATGTTTAEALIAKLLQSSVTASANTTSNAIVSKLASSSVTASANTTANSLVSKLIASTVNAAGNVTADLKIADLLSTSLSGTASAEALLDITTTLIGDPYIDNVSLLLQGDDNPSSVTQNNTFKDSSGTITTITPNNNVTQGTFSPFDRALTNSGGSAYFDGTGDYLSTTANNTLVFGTSPYTVETWVYQTARPNVQWIIGGNSGFQLGINSSGFIFGSVAGVGDMTAATTAIVLNTWTHVAIIRNTTSAGGVTYYINGKASGTATDSTNYTFVPTLNIGTTNGNLSVNPFTGYLSNLRVVKGTAVYTSNFQPSTIPLTAITNTSLLLNFTNAAIFDGVKLNNIETVGGAQINTSIKKYGTGSLVFDGNGDYLSIKREPFLTLGSSDFTIEFWVYAVSSGIQGIYSSRTAQQFRGFQLYLINNKVVIVTTNNTTSWSIDNSGAPPGSAISLNQWTHICLSRSGSTWRVFINGILDYTITSSISILETDLSVNIGSDYNGTNPFNGYLDDLRITKGIARYTSNFNTNLPAKLSSLIPNYLVSRSLRFNSTDLAYLNRTPTVAGSRTTWTWSGWIKRGNLSNTEYIIFGANGVGGVNSNSLRINADRLIFEMYNGASQDYAIITTSVFRDISSWYHIVAVWDTTNAIELDRIRLYVNGIQITSFTPGNSLVQSTNSIVNSTVIHYIGGNTNYFNGYMSEINFIDGQALTPDSFGIRNTSTGVWSPKEYTGTYGINGFHLNFSDITQIGRDFSGNNNNWTPSGFSVTPGTDNDSLTDVPTPNGTDNGFGGEVRGNYATWNPLRNPGAGFGTFSNGNLQINGTAGTVNCIAVGTMPFLGKMYCEITIVTAGSDTTGVGVGLIPINSNQTTIAINMTTGIYYLINGNKRITGVNSSYGTSYTSGDIIGIAVDTDAETVTFYKNNVSQPTISGTGIISTGVLPYIGFQDAGSPSIIANFGQRPFVYKAPSGFKALNTANLPTPAIGGGGESNLANKYMDITTYTGTGAAQSIFNSGFKPDFVWIKSRSDATGHAIYDINRGVNKQLASNSDALEVTNASGLTSFDNTGFSIGSFGDINLSGKTYIAWQWRAGGTPLTTQAGNTITSSVSVNSVSKFSITTYTGNGTAGATIAHALGVIPRMVIIKSTTGAVSNWAVYHGSLSNTSSLFLNTNGVSLTSNTYWNNTNPTVNLISLGTSDLVNANTRNYVAYAWAEVDGFSKFNSYVGNNSTDGTFVYTGFKPKYILIKCSTAAANWVLYNSIVNTGNPVVNELFANTTNAENSVTSGDEIDFLSNGFKLRSTNAAINAAQTYIYAAFAETPFKYATAALTPEVKTVTVDYLVVAGGGSAAYRSSDMLYYSGGGGGGLRSTVDGNGGNVAAESKINLAKGTTYTIIVGGGGAASLSVNTLGANGNPSSISGIGITTITSTGGGRGVLNDSNGTSGGSGSGAGGNDSDRTGGPAVTPTQGFAGGSVDSDGSADAGAGGGGAGGLGGSVSPGQIKGGAGGNAKSNTITGTSIFYAGGGPGGGGGGGSRGDFGTGYLHAANRGSGGYVTSGSSSVNSGSSGVVIIRSPIDIINPSDYSPAIKSTDGTDFIFTFNGDGSIKFS